jgi:site-specific DNA-methyltransferase (adenine-specific)
MTPYYQDDQATIYHGDCREIMPTLKFDVIVTDPPYGINYAGYNHGTIEGDETTDLAQWITNYTSKPTVTFGANHYAAALPTTGAWSCWDKRTTEQADKMFGSPFELIWASGDDKPGRIYRIMHGGVVNADGAGNKRQHPTQKPIKLMTQVISDWVPDNTPIIADPFMGSGTTLVAAKQLGRKAIGIEINEEYCQVAVDRLAQGVLFT